MHTHTHTQHMTDSPWRAVCEKKKGKKKTMSQPKATRAPNLTDNSTGNCYKNCHKILLHKLLLYTNNRYRHLLHSVTLWEKHPPYKCGKQTSRVTFKDSYLGRVGIHDDYVFRRQANQGIKNDATARQWERKSQTA